MSPPTCWPASARLGLHRLRSAEVAGVEQAATLAARRVVPVAGATGRSEVALGWAEIAEPDPDAADVVVQRLTPSALSTLAACFALCWPDATAEPYPGAATTVAEVLAVAAGLNVHEIWAKAALLHDLPGAGYVVVAGSAPGAEVRLGPAVATWPSGQLALLRRAHDRLPTNEAAT